MIVKFDAKTKGVCVLKLSSGLYALSSALITIKPLIGRTSGNGRSGYATIRARMSCFPNNYFILGSLANMGNSVRTMD